MPFLIQEQFDRPPIHRQHQIRVAIIIDIRKHRPAHHPNAFQVGPDRRHFRKVPALVYQQHRPPRPGDLSGHEAPSHKQIQIPILVPITKGQWPDARLGAPPNDHRGGPAKPVEADTRPHRQPIFIVGKPDHDGRVTGPEVDPEDRGGVSAAHLIKGSPPIGGEGGPIVIPENPQPTAASRADDDIIKAVGIDVIATDARTEITVTAQQKRLTGKIIKVLPPVLEPKQVTHLLEPCFGALGIDRILVRIHRPLWFRHQVTRI